MTVDINCGLFVYVLRAIVGGGVQVTGRQELKEVQRPVREQITRLLVD
jgi:hypothetical protein